MNQVVQNLNGDTQLLEVPVPKIKKGHLLIRTTVSLISSGTERMLVEFGKASYLEKARQQPEKVKQVIDKIKTDGFFETFDRVKSKLDQPLPLGYCNTGIVVASDIPEFSIGDRVISNGPHAEFVRVPKNLCAKIPESVDFETASFTVPSSIGLQGIRLINPSLGETVVVFGLGLIGLLSVQILKANGCRVIGIDTNKGRCELARKFGVDTVDLSNGQDPVKFCLKITEGRGVDAVLITAATKSDELIHNAAEMCRVRGRIVLVGVVGLNLRREDFYKKELSFQVSSSYGPGRYDPSYEEQGVDYPFGFVRWTEQRNFEAVLSLMQSGSLNPKELITHTYELKDVGEAYAGLSDSSALGIALKYPDSTAPIDLKKLSKIKLGSEKHSNQIIKSGSRVSFIGAGNYASTMLLPAFKKAGANFSMIASSGGFSGAQLGKKFGFSSITTNSEEIFNDADTDAVVIATRHNSHQKFILDAILAGKSVFVEKPLCLNLAELEEIENLLSDKSKVASPLLMVGFNRRFAPQVIQIKSLLMSKPSPKSFIMTVNAGHLDSEHWTQDPEVGGGRIVGEGCHFIDLLRFLAGCRIISSSICSMETSTNDTVTINLKFEDGSVGCIHYFSNGSNSFPKERLEVFADGSILQLDNYRKLIGFGWPKFGKMNLKRQDKGQNECAKSFVQVLNNGGKSPIPVGEILEVSRVVIELSNELSINYKK